MKFPLAAKSINCCYSARMKIRDVENEIYEIAIAKSPHTIQNE